MSSNGFTPGETLPVLDVPIDRAFIVAGAIASQDFEDVHHDPDAAINRGTPDIFISINTTNGVVGRYVTDWTGPAARLRSVSLRLGMPLHPGDVLHLTGEIIAADAAGTTVKVTGSHDRGIHVTATVNLTRQEAAA
ncbi:MaoC/PaaZ C-terminal domain-containing protein [Arthrobacter sp. ZGTC212]|uniref:MaoC/PaaZ C-terminal domain-containing protein n=1 Tax=Arthrobacter sp. ZGTC212 TaxID=2058899 RepID=UPI000CE41B2B|nr:MaoC/PaaZ C-terminal domain-containing protein [Arthrobacter sp. ZGTC212]